MNEDEYTCFEKQFFGGINRNVCFDIHVHNVGVVRAPDALQNSCCTVQHDFVLNLTLYFSSVANPFRILRAIKINGQS